MRKLLAILVFLSLLLPSSIKAQSNESNILFNDNFNSNSLNNWKVRWGNWRVENGVLISELSGINKPGRIEIGSDNWQDYKLEVDVNNISGIDEGIGFRNNSIYNTNYELTLRHGTGPNNTPEAVLYKVYWQGSQENATVLAKYRPTSFINNHPYHITIEVLNTNIKAWINQELVFNYKDDDLRTRTGFISLSTWTGSIGYEKVQFDNIKVTSLDPQPFLDLPWDYKAQGSSFNYMALNPFSWFDHQYPLQNQCCNWQVMTYVGETIQRPYRSHNGYDYGSTVGVGLNTPVLAAASGKATFKSWQNSGGAGNVIKIDHGNGYQTWYEHLSSDDLIISTEGQSIDVKQGQQIGKVGMTGKTDGPHIHFSVFKDSNNNNSFNDEFPYGVTDPLGWEGETTDPWSVWNNGTRSGTSSYNLFLPASPPKSVNISLAGGALTTDDTIIIVPAGAYGSSFDLVYKVGPFESLSNYTTSITPSIYLNAYSNGQPVTQFSIPIKIIVNYSKANLTNINENTLKFRYFNEQNKSWEELPTTIDTSNKTISTEVTHLSHFAVMGDEKDLTPPTTIVNITGDQGEQGWYHTPVKIKLLGQDNKDGVGLEYTLYTLNGTDWFEYTNPLVFENEGDYQIVYQSYDKAENQEQKQTLNFHIDKTPPEAKIYFDNQKKDLTVIGMDTNQTTVTSEIINYDKNDEDKKEKEDDHSDNKLSKKIYKITDQAGNTLEIGVKNFDKDKEKDSQNYSLRIYYLKYNDQKPIYLPKNQYLVKFEDKQKKQIKLLQEFSLKDKVKIRIRYNAKLNKSEIYIDNGEKEKLKETRNGLVTLFLTTNKGSLEYSY